MRVFTLRNARGLEAEVTDHGGIILSLRVPDRSGRPADVVLGFDSPEAYAENTPYFGALIGRYANRIGYGRFSLDGRTHTLTRNEAPHHLHGGRKGFDSVLWEAEPVGGSALDLRHTSPDGDEGYPGTVRVRVRYALTDANQLVVDSRATTDLATPVSLTQHSYFNLAGEGAGDVLDHVVTIPADRFTPVDGTLLPTGEIREVAGTPFDFREPRRLGDRIRDDDEQLRCAGGYDHNYVLGTRSTSEPRLAARVHHPASGRTLEVRTTEPGVQLYSGNGLAGVIGKGGRAYSRFAGMALETQKFPDSPNRPEFPPSILRPGETFRSRTIFGFGTMEE